MQHPAEKSKLHPRNKHRQRYDFKQLITCSEELKAYVKLNDYGDESIDFFDPQAVKALNTALLKYFYGVTWWDIPPGYLCPPIPSRADYIHYLADLLAHSPNIGKVRCLDVGVGANGVYPIIGNSAYGWEFVGVDIDPVAIAAVQKIVDMNPSLSGVMSLRLQSNPKDIFKGIIHKDEFFDLMMCNPPFHASPNEAMAGTLRKLTNLKGKKVSKPRLNFGGKANELWCEGGEARFIADMVAESKLFAHQCGWFSTLVSKETTLKTTYRTLKEMRATKVKTIQMSQGNKVSRVVAWSFL